MLHKLCSLSWSFSIPDNLSVIKLWHNLWHKNKWPGKRRLLYPYHSQWRLKKFSNLKLILLVSQSAPFSKSWPSTPLTKWKRTDYWSFVQGAGSFWKQIKIKGKLNVCSCFWIRKWLSPELAEGTDDRWDYANRPRRTLAEALRDFPKSVSDLPVEALARVLIYRC